MTSEINKSKVNISHEDNAQSMIFEAWSVFEQDSYLHIWLEFELEKRLRDKPSLNQIIRSDY